MKINRVALVQNAPTYKGIPGAVLAKEEGVLIVKTEDSFIRVMEWSSEAKIRVGDRLR